MISEVGEWRSLVARLLWEQDAAGSNPVSPMRSETSPQLVVKPSRKGRFFLVTSTCAKEVPKPPNQPRCIGTTSPTGVDRVQHLQKTWPKQSRNLRFTDPPSNCLQSSGFKNETTVRDSTAVPSGMQELGQWRGWNQAWQAPPNEPTEGMAFTSQERTGPRWVCGSHYQWTPPINGCMSHRLPTCWPSNKAPFAQCVVTADLKPARTGFTPPARLAVQLLTTCQPSGKHWLNEQFRWWIWKPSVVPLSERQNRIPLRPSAMPRV